MKKVMRKLSVLALVCCMVLGLGIGVRANTSAVSSRAASTNLALGATATANDVEDGTSFTADLAIDGNSDTRWATNQGTGSPRPEKWLQIDFGEVTAFDLVDIQWEQQNIQNFVLEISDDAQDWAVIHNRSTAPVSKLDSVSFSELQYARYLRVRATDYNGDWPSVSIFEVSVYNTQDTSEEETGNYKIYPIPQSVTDSDAAISLSDEVNVIAESGIDSVTEDRIEEVISEHDMTPVFTDEPQEGEVNLYVGINGSGEAADTHADVPRDVFTEAENKYDMHVVKVFEDGDIVVLGEDTDAAYYGLATLEQMLDQSVDGTMKVSTFEDYAFQKYRGVVEGYYGYPWTVDGTLSFMDYAKRYKMNVFLYGPKSDPYHLGLWDEDYPETVSEEDSKNGVRTADEMAQIAAAATASKVSFVWVAHPAMQKPIDFTNEETTDEGIARLMTKFEHMYELGVRQFGIFVDDISNDYATSTCDMQIYMLNQVQEQLYAKYNTEGSAPEDQVKGLFFTPAWYTTGSSGASSNLPKFQQLHEDIEICFTGSDVFSSISNSSATTFKNWIGRTPVMWWNYPVNDAEDSVFFTNPINFDYSQDSNPTNIKGVLSNPMNYSEASKVALFGVADYTWNPQAFDAEQNWYDCFDAIIPDDPEMADALRTVYGNLNDDYVPTEISRLIAGYSGTKESAAAIKNKMIEIMDAVEKVETLADSDNAAYRLIVTEAQTSMNKLYDMAAAIGGAMAVVSSDDPVEQVQGYYLATAAKERLDIPRNERYQIISLEGAGEDIYNSVLQAVSSDEGLKPFVDTAYSAMGDFDPDSADTSGVQIDSIQIEPSENVEVPQGSTYQFTASVSSPQGDLDAVKWSVSGATAEGTTINNNGVLSVDGNELSQTLTVTATSAFDADASASVTVRVTDRIYVDPTIPVNLGPSATILGSSGSSAAGEGPENIFDDLDTTKWCPGNGTNTNQWVAFDLGSVKQISSWQIVGGGIEHELYAPSSFALQVLVDEDPTEEELSSRSYLSNNANWEDVSRYDNNSENIVNTTFDELVEGRYFRLYIYNGSQTGAPYPATRIFETRVYGVDKAIVERTHALTIDPEIEHGSISVDAAHFEEGAKVNVYIEPDEGYQLKEGSLNYNGTAVEGTSFLMPGEDVVLSAEFEPAGTVGEPDKEALNAAITKAEALNEADYTADSWAAMQEALTAAKTVAADETADQAAIDAAADALTAAIEALVEAEDPQDAASEAAVQALRNMVEKAEALGSDDAALNAAIEAAQAVLAKETPTATEVVTALLDLSEAMQAVDAGESTDALRADVQATIDFITENILTNVDNIRPGKVQALVNAVDAAKAVLADDQATADALKAANEAMTKAAQELWEIVTKAELEALIEAANGYLDGDYTAESLEALQAAIDAAQAVAINDDATTAEVTEAITNLSNAIAGLVNEAGVNKSALEYEIELVNEMIANLDDYVPSSVEGLADKLAAAQQVYDDANATQEEVDAATQALREARLNARTKADVSALEELIAYINSLDLRAYTAETAEPVRALAKQANEMIVNAEITQDEVDALAEELQSAIDELQPVSAGSVTNDTTNTAASSMTSMMFALMAAAGAAAALAYRRKRN